MWAVHRVIWTVEVYQRVVPNKTLSPEAVKNVLACLLGLYLHWTFLLGSDQHDKYILWRRVLLSRSTGSCDEGHRLSRLWGTYLPDSSVYKCGFPLSVSMFSQQDPQFSTAESSCSYRTAGVLAEGLALWGSDNSPPFIVIPHKGQTHWLPISGTFVLRSVQRNGETFMLAAAEAGAPRLQHEGGSSTVLSGMKGNRSAATTLQVWNLTQWCFQIKRNHKWFDFLSYSPCPLFPSEQVRTAHSKKAA